MNLQIGLTGMLKIDSLDIRGLLFSRYMFRCLMSIVYQYLYPIDIQHCT